MTTRFKSRQHGPNTASLSSAAHSTTAYTADSTSPTANPALVSSLTDYSTIAPYTAAPPCTVAYTATQPLSAAYLVIPTHFEY
ncbi:hypothetical protein U1Q18_010014 [Sarracenia purpurea var. burkii]